MGPPACQRKAPLVRFVRARRPEFRLCGSAYVKVKTKREREREREREGGEGSISDKRQAEPVVERNVKSDVERKMSNRDPVSTVRRVICRD